MELRLNKKRWFLAVNLSFILGVFLSEWVSLNFRIFLWVGAVGLIFFYAVGQKRKKLIATGVVFLSLLLGIYWAGRLATKCPAGYVCGLARAEVTGWGMVNECREKNWGLFECEVGNLIIGEEKYKGKILADSDRAFFYGDWVRFSGFVEIVENFSDFDYRGYLAKEGIWAVLKKTQLQLLFKGERSWEMMSFEEKLKCRIFQLRQNVFSKMEQLWEGERLGLMKALIGGDKSGMSDELKADFQRAGVSHLVAISGMHVAIIADLALEFFLALGLWRRRAFSLAGVILFLFVIFVGAPASAARAFLMASLGFLGKLLGRKVWANNLLFFTAALLLFKNPLLLGHDIGFKLSFAAVWGLINLGPVLENFLEKCSVPDWGGIRRVIAASAAAQLATLPIAVYAFGYFSLVSILANVLVFWVVFPLIIGGIAALTCSFFSWELAWLLALVSGWGASYLIRVSGWLAGWRWAGIEIGKFIGEK